MPLDLELKKILRDLTSMDKMYEHIRLVDPVRNIIIAEDGKGSLDLLNRSCYGVWNKRKVCQNCISMRAHNENDTFVKLEHNGEKLYLVTAFPVSIVGKTHIAELIKDITKSMLVVDEGKITQVSKLIDEANLLAMTDPLTGLFNKRYLGEKLPVELSKAAIERRPLSLLIGDIDFFKKINDTHGHLAGDHVLMEIGLLIQSMMKDNLGWSCRYGGEEFLFLLPNTTTEEATTFAEALRQKIHEHSYVFQNTPIRLSMSFGIETMSKGCIMDSDQLIAGADDKLYQAKKLGRNRVVS